MTIANPSKTDDIKISLKERSKLTKNYDSTKKMTQPENDYINKMTDKLQSPSTAPKTYWAILSHLLCNKKILAKPLLLVDCKFSSGFC